MAWHIYIHSYIHIWASLVAQWQRILLKCRSCQRYGSVLGQGRSPAGGNGNPLQYSCLENHMDRGTWWATVHWVAKNQTCLSTHAYARTYIYVCMCVCIIHTYLCTYIYIYESVKQTKQQHTHTDTYKYAQYNFFLE